MNRVLRTRIAIVLLTILLFLPCCNLNIAFRSMKISVASASDGSAILSGGPTIDSSTAIVMEVNSRAVLYSKNSTTQAEPISLT